MGQPAASGLPGGTRGVPQGLENTDTDLCAGGALASAPLEHACGLKAIAA